METQIGKKHEMKTGIMKGFVGIMVSQNQGRVFLGPYNEGCNILESTLIRLFIECATYSF